MKCIQRARGRLIPSSRKSRKSSKNSNNPRSESPSPRGVQSSLVDAPISSQQQLQGSSHGQYQEHPQSHQDGPWMGYTPTGSSPYPATNPPTASPPVMAPVRAYAPQAEAPVESYLPEAPSTSPSKVTEQPAPKAPPTSTSATGAVSSGSAAAAESPGNRPSLDMCRTTSRSQLRGCR